jgi:hypothetical protein
MPNFAVVEFLRNREVPDSSVGPKLAVLPEVFLPSFVLSRGIY